MTVAFIPSLDGKCGTCKFYVRDVVYEQQGECRRFPPSVRPEWEDDFPKFPFVRSTTFCGEYRDVHGIPLVTP